MISASNEGTIRLTRISSAYWRVSFDIPPLNIFGPANIPQLEEIVALLETDERVKVVVFDSAVDGFFLYHYKLSGETGGVFKISIRADRPACIARHACQVESCAGGVDCVYPGPCYWSRQRTRSCM